MTETVPDTLTLTEHHYDEVRGTCADVRIAVSEPAAGSRSSRRVAALRAHLADRGFAEDDVSLENLSLTPWSWVAVVLLVLAPVGALFATHEPRPTLAAAGLCAALYVVLRAGRVGTVTATLKVRCADATRVGVAVDAALSAGVEVSGIQWRHDLASASPADWALRCVERAGARAARLAAVLGTSIQGVHAYHEEQILPPETYAGTFAAELPAKRHMAAGSVAESLGDVKPAAQRAGLRVTITYRLVSTGCWS